METVAVISFLLLCALPPVLGVLLICRALFRPARAELGRNVDLTLGVVLIAGFACLVAILVPIFRGAVEVSPRTTCLSNANQIAKALIMYAGDNDDRMPLGGNWCDAVYDYVASHEPYRCPSLQSSPYGFWLSKGLAGKSIDINTTDAITTILLFDSPGGKNRVGGRDDVRYRHDEKATASFLDLHTKIIPKEDVGRYTWAMSTR